MSDMIHQEEPNLHCTKSSGNLNFYSGFEKRGMFGCYFLSYCTLILFGKYVRLKFTSLVLYKHFQKYYDSEEGKKS